MKYMPKVDYSGDKGQGEWAFLATDVSGEATLVTSVIGLYNKGYTLYDSAQDALQLAKNFGFNKVKLVIFEKQEDGMPFIEAEIP